MEPTPDFRHVETLRTSASPERVFELWADTTTWATWDPPVDRVVLDGPFRVGTRGTMVMAGGIEMPFELVEVTPDVRYLDVLRMGDLEIRIDHVVEPDGDGSVITVTTEITGPGAEGVGPMVTADAPKALAALVAQAESSSDRVPA